MNEINSLNPNDFHLIISLLLPSVGFILYWFISQDDKKKDWFFKSFKTPNAWVNWIVFKRLCGALILGIIPAIIAWLYLPFSFYDLGLNFNNIGLTLKWTFGIGLFMAIANFFAAKHPKNLSMYPPMRINHWTNKILFLNLFSWVAYLISYEFLFRGILLYTCNEYLGFWPAVVINIAFYALAHIPKGFTETIGCFPYGFLLCYVTLLTGNLWFAIITHSILAVSTDIYSIFHSQQMKWE